MTLFKPSRLYFPTFFFFCKIQKKKYCRHTKPPLFFSPQGLWLPIGSSFSKGQSDVKRHTAQKKRKKRLQSTLSFFCLPFLFCLLISLPFSQLQNTPSSLLHTLSFFFVGFFFFSSLTNTTWFQNTTFQKTKTEHQIQKRGGKSASILKSQESNPQNKKRKPKRLTGKHFPKHKKGVQSNDSLFKLNSKVFKVSKTTAKSLVFFVKPPSKTDSRDNKEKPFPPAPLCILNFRLRVVLDPFFSLSRVRMSFASNPSLSIPERLFFVFS